MELVNHAGRHSESYHKQARGILNTYLNKLHKGEFQNAKEALDAAMGFIDKEITSGKLKLYTNKEVWKP